MKKKLDVTETRMMDKHRRTKFEIIQSRRWLMWRRLRVTLTETTTFIWICYEERGKTCYTEDTSSEGEREAENKAKEVEGLHRRRKDLTKGIQTNGTRVCSRFGTWRPKMKKRKKYVQ